MKKTVHDMKVKMKQYNKLQEKKNEIEGELVLLHQHQFLAENKFKLEKQALESEESTSGNVQHDFLEGVNHVLE